MTARYIWLMPDRQTAWLWKVLGIHLAKRTGWVPLMIVASAQDKAFYEAQGGVPFPGEIVVRDDYYLALVNGAFDAEPADEVFRRAAAYEKDHGVILMRSMLLADRHMGRGFIPGGAGYPRSHVSEHSTLTRSLQACLSSAAFWERLAESHPPALVLSYGGGGGVGGKPYALLCRKRGIPLRILFPFRFGDTFYWARDEFGRSPEFETALENFPWPEKDDVDEVGQLIQPSGLATNPLYTRRIARNLQWRRIAYKSVRAILQRAFWRLKGYRKAYIGAKLAAQIKNFVNARRNMDQLNRLAIRDLSKLDGRRIVYFTLQQEPESSTLVVSPFSTNQMALARELALSLPADVLLVVKEHIWALYGRPSGFYSQLTEMPNVVLAHPQVSSLELIHRAELVCVITSSAGYEAAVLGKPVIHFGDYSTLFTLPHVYQLTSTKQLDEIPGILALSKDVDEMTIRRRAGARYFFAARSVCMDLAPLKIHGRKILLTDDECAVVLQPLLRTLLISEPVSGTCTTYPTTSPS